MAMTRWTSTALAAAVAMGLGSAAAPSLAATAEPFDLAQANTFGEEKLEAFVVAMLEVENIRRTYSQAVAQADDDQARAGLIEEAGAEMVQAVEETPGITLDEYNAISEAAQTDPDLAQHLNRLIGEQAQQAQ